MDGIELEMDYGEDFYLLASPVTCPEDAKFTYVMCHWHELMW